MLLGKPPERKRDWRSNVNWPLARRLFGIGVGDLLQQEDPLWYWANWSAPKGRFGGIAKHLLQTSAHLLRLERGGGIVPGTPPFQFQLGSFLIEMGKRLGGGFIPRAPMLLKEETGWDSMTSQDLLEAAVGLDRAFNSIMMETSGSISNRFSAYPPLGTPNLILEFEGLLGLQDQKDPRVRTLGAYFSLLGRAMHWMRQPDVSLPLDLDLLWSKAHTLDRM